MSRIVKHVAKKDRYSRARGGSSQFMDIFCAQCRTHILLYQKDGKGALIRLYLDRIFDPSPYRDWQNETDLKRVPRLTCPKCQTVIGMPMIYDSEARLALRLIQGTFSKKPSNGTYTLLSEADIPDEGKVT